MSKPIFCQEEKELFIAYYMKKREIKKTSLFSLFRKTAPYEIKINKDCSEFSKTEILNMYSNFEAKSINVLLNYNSILKAYTCWKKDYQKVICLNSYNEISQKMLKDFISEDDINPITRQEILNIEEQLFNYTDKAIVECLWEGVAGNSMTDLISISENMIDQENKILCFKNGRVVPLTERLLYLLNKAFQETEYICYGTTQRTKKLNGRGCLYKSRDNAKTLYPDTEDKSFRWVYRKIQLFRDYIGISKFTMKNISTSGMCFYLDDGMKKNDLNLKNYLLTDEGKRLMDKYGYKSSFRTDNVVYRYRQFLNQQD